MKRYLAWTIAAVAMGAAMMAHADSEVVDGVTWYYTTYTSRYKDSTIGKYVYETNAMIVAGADKYMGDLTVPSSLGGYAVKEIGYSAFSGCSALTSVMIPEGVTSIGSAAFYNCSALTSMTIPEGVTWIGGSAFHGCSALTSVTIPEGVTSIDNAAFYYCSALTSVTIPEGVTSIDSSAFSGCSALTSVMIPEGVTSIGEYAFYGCSALERFDVPASVTSLGNSVICRCDSLRTITVAEGNANYKCINDCIVSASGTTLIAVPFGCEEVAIPEGVSEIPGSMFYNDDALEFVDIPSSVKTIGDSAFGYCDALMIVDIPEGVASIGSYAFSDCDALTSVTIPEGVTSIGSYAFGWCYALTSVTIPSSVTSIGSYAFCNCYALKDVTLLGAPPSGIENSSLLNGNSRNISYPREYGGAWMKVINDIGKFRGYNRKQPEVAVVSSKIRVSDPTILDVVYKVTSAVTNTVRVRALAFEDGERSFAKVVRPETFVADTNGVETAGNVGDAVAANVEHTLSWKVSSDWSNQLAKVSFEVLASEGDLLPLEVRTIPASDQYGKMDVTWNAITESQWFDALLWLYADKTEGLTLANGVLKNDETVLASGDALKYTYTSRGGVATSSTMLTVASYVFGKMGYTVLSGEVLNYVNEETRLGLSPSGARQYGYKIVE